MKVLYERVAGIDVHKDMVKVAIRSPGEKPWTRKTEMLEFRTFYGVLQADGPRAAPARRDARGDGGVAGCTPSRCITRCASRTSTEVMVINPAHAKALKGHKTDAKDCDPAAELYRVRAAVRLLHPGART